MIIVFNIFFPLALFVGIFCILKIIYNFLCMVGQSNEEKYKKLYENFYLSMALMGATWVVVGLNIVAKNQEFIIYHPFKNLIF